ncbi:MAG: type II toxin-antitoxin system MazE family antitoxin [Thermodesulfobacteriota bacterium]
MTERATFTLEEENYEFLVKWGGSNRSAFINRLLKEEKQRILAKKLIKANKEEAEDINYQNEIDSWDVTLLDGIEES